MNIFNALTLTEYLNNIKATELKSDKLKSGDIVYLVDKCNIYSFIVHGLFMVQNEECAVLIGKESANFTYETLSSLGSSLFESLKEAKEEVSRRKKDCDCILSTEMNVLEFKSYLTTKKGTTLTAFYAILDNGYVYYKDYFSCGHLIKASRKDADKMLEESINQYDMIPKKNKTMPALKNMYKVMTDVGNGWLYAEDSYPLTCLS